MPGTRILAFILFRRENYLEKFRWWFLIGWLCGGNFASGREEISVRRMPEICYQSSSTSDCDTRPIETRYYIVYKLGLLGLGVSKL